MKKADLKLNIQKTKIMASSTITSWQMDGEKLKAVAVIFEQDAQGRWKSNICLLVCCRCFVCV